MESFVNIPVWSGSLAAAFAEIQQKISSGQHCQIVTLNAEMLLLMRESATGRAIILSADFFICDSFAVWVWLKLHHKNPVRITGIDFAEYLIKKISEQNGTVALLGGKTPETNRRAALFWSKQQARIVLHESGPKINLQEITNPDTSDLIQRLKITKPNLICAGFGHGKQEGWISQAKKELDQPTVFIGVGGALDVWGGEVRRAPRIFQVLGLEWLWRLIQEPRRLKRIVRAVFVFPIKALLDFLV